MVEPIRFKPQQTKQSPDFVHQTVRSSSFCVDLSRSRLPSYAWQFGFPSFFLCLSNRDPHSLIDLLCPACKSWPPRLSWVHRVLTVPWSEMWRRALSCLVFQRRYFSPSWGQNPTLPSTSNVPQALCSSCFSLGFSCPLTRLKLGLSLDNPALTSSQQIDFWPFASVFI